MPPTPPPFAFVLHKGLLPPSLCDFERGCVTPSRPTPAFPQHMREEGGGLLRRQRVPPGRRSTEGRARARFSTPTEHLSSRDLSGMSLQWMDRRPPDGRRTKGREGRREEEEETAENGNSWQRHRPFWPFSPPQCESAGQREHLVIRRGIIRPRRRRLRSKSSARRRKKNWGEWRACRPPRHREGRWGLCLCGERYE